MPIKDSAGWFVCVFKQNDTTKKRIEKSNRIVRDFIQPFNGSAVFLPRIFYDPYNILCIFAGRISNQFSQMLMV